MDDLSMQETETALRSLIQRAALLGDIGAPEEYADVYTVGAVWEASTGRDEGVEAIIEAARVRRERKISGPGTNTRHEVDVLRIDFDDSEHARVKSRFRFLRDTTTVPTVAVAGSYDDWIELEGGEWKIARRVSAVD